MSCVPANQNHPHPMFRRDRNVKHYASRLIGALLDNFTESLQRLDVDDVARPTIMKANFGTLSSLNILPDNQAVMLGKFMECFRRINTDVDMELVLTANRCGQKERGPFHLNALCRVSGVQSVSYAVGSSLMSTDPDVDMFWSRRGLEELRGRLRPTWSLGETANFQSNLDGFEMDFRPELRDVFRTDNPSCTLQFVEIYAATAGFSFACPDVHPVSVTLQTAARYGSRERMTNLQSTKQYLETMFNLSHKADVQVSLRLEGVFRVTPAFPVGFSPDYFYRPDAL